MTVTLITAFRQRLAKVAEEGDSAAESSVDEGLAVLHGNASILAAATRPKGHCLSLDKAARANTAPPPAAPNEAPYLDCPAALASGCLIATTQSSRL